VFASSSDPPPSATLVTTPVIPSSPHLASTQLPAPALSPVLSLPFYPWQPHQPPFLDCPILPATFAVQAATLIFDPVVVVYHNRIDGRGHIAQDGDTAQDGIPLRMGCRSQRRRGACLNPAPRRSSPSRLSLDKWCAAVRGRRVGVVPRGCFHPALLHPLLSSQPPRAHFDRLFAGERGLVAELLLAGSPSSLAVPPSPPPRRPSLNTARLLRRSESGRRLRPLSMLWSCVALHLEVGPLCSTSPPDVRYLFAAESRPLTLARPTRRLGTGGALY